VRLIESLPAYGVVGKTPVAIVGHRLIGAPGGHVSERGDFGHRYCGQLPERMAGGPTGAD